MDTPTKSPWRKITAWREITLVEHPANDRWAWYGESMEWDHVVATELGAGCAWKVVIDGHENDWTLTWRVCPEEGFVARMVDDHGRVLMELGAPSTFKGLLRAFSKRWNEGAARYFVTTPPAPTMPGEW